jgi:hypothetical protein
MSLLRATQVRLYCLGSITPSPGCAGPGGAEGIQRMYMWQRQWQGAVADSRGREQSAIVVHLQVSTVVWEVCMGGVCMGGVCMGGVCMGGVCMGGVYMGRCWAI